MLRLGTTTEWRVWIKRGWPLWMSLLLVLAGLLVWQWASQTETTVRRIGLIYEGVGVLAVIFDLTKVMNRNGVDWPFVRLLRYLRQLPFFWARKASGAGFMAGGLNSHGGGAMLSNVLGPGASLEARVGRLEKLVTANEGQLSELGRRLRVEEIARAEGDAAERSQREQLEARLLGTIKELEVGSLDLSLFGISWLLVGMVMTTGTSELCMLLGCA